MEQDSVATCIGCKSCSFRREVIAGLTASQAGDRQCLINACVLQNMCEAKCKNFEAPPTPSSRPVADLKGLRPPRALSQGSGQQLPFS